MGVLSSGAIIELKRVLGKDGGPSRKLTWCEPLTRRAAGSPGSMRMAERGAAADFSPHALRLPGVIHGSMAVPPQEESISPSTSDGLMASRCTPYQ